MILATAIFLAVTAAVVLPRLPDRYHFNSVMRERLACKLEMGESWESVVRWYSGYTGCGWVDSENYISRQLDGPRHYLFLNKHGNWIGV